MAIVRQMSELYLRGSLANVTMKNLTEEEIQFCESMTEHVANHDRMKKHRYQVMRVLGETIGADYRDDRLTAEQEYKIAIWRAVVNLFCHRHYKFRCCSCNSTHRITKTTGLPRAIDQAHIPCPVCNKVKVTDPGDTDFEVEQFVDHDEFQDAYKDFQTGIPECESTIIAIPGGGKYNEEELQKELEDGLIQQDVYERRTGHYRYDDPYAVIEDEDQMVKFFGEFVWGYFKQQIRENSRVEHRKRPTKIMGRADEVVVEEILSVAKKLKIPTTFCKNTQPENGWWNIGIIGLQTPPEFTGELLPIFEKAANAGVKYNIDNSMIRVEHDDRAPQVEAFVIKPEHVMVLDNNASISDDKEDGGFSIQQMSFKTVGGCKVELEDHVGEYETRDVMEAVFGSLPDGDCRKIFELYTQTGTVYDAFREVYNYDSEPKQAHMAKFLGITPRSVKQHIENIRHMCLAYDFTNTH